MKYLLLALCCSYIHATAQDAQQIINAEKAFAAYAKEVDTRSAFLAFMDTGAVMFASGKPQNAIAAWTQTPPSTDKLLWSPAFAGISASEDLGFTTGPWQYKKTLADTAVASGVFTSVWRKNAQGQWKNIVDLGYAYVKPAYLEPETKISPSLPPSVPAIKVNAIELDQQLIRHYNTQGSIAFKNVLAEDCWSNINGAEPCTTPQQHFEVLKLIPDGLKMTPSGSGLSKSGDLAYVYGVVDYQNVKQNYLRVWKQTTEGWKIILQVLQWKS